MKTTDFKYKTPAICIVKDCLDPICWVSKDEDIGLCEEHYKELEEEEKYLEWLKFRELEANKK